MPGAGQRLWGPWEEWAYREETGGIGLAYSPPRRFERQHEGTLTLGELQSHALFADPAHGDPGE